MTHTKGETPVIPRDSTDEPINFQTFGAHCTYRLYLLLFYKYKYIENRFCKSA